MAAAKKAVKERLSREVVAAGALALADAEGIEAVTVRRVATALGVTPMALYWHFEDKDALLDGGVAERVLTEVRLPAAGGDGPWDAQFRALLESLLTALRAHPQVADVVKSRILVCEAGRELTEQALDILRRAGCAPDLAAQLAVHAALTLVALVGGEPGMWRGGESEEERDQRLRTKWAALQALPPKRYPRLVEAAGPLTDCADAGTWFDRGLDVLMAGVRGSVRAAAG